MPQKILFICSTSDFPNHTRRATIEAIGRQNPNARAVCLYSYWKKKTAKLNSASVQMGSYYYFIPRKLLRNPVLNRINHWCNLLFGSEQLHGYDYICFTKPDQYFLLPFFRQYKKIFTVSDPFHLMGSPENDVSKMLSHSDYVFATAKALADDYMPKYFGGRLKPSLSVHYWPNCVDTEIWNLERIVPTGRRQVGPKSSYRIGFAGNFIPTVDLNLLEHLARHFSGHRFILAGRNSLNPGSPEAQQFDRIIKMPNVEYKGLIPFNKLPQEVASWDVGLMIDSIDEFGRYIHHNKVYQYLSLGLPVIYQRNLTDYEQLQGPVYGADNPEEYVQQLEKVISQLQSGADFTAPAVALARQNNSDSRAKAFLECLN
ncbi:MAG TPA: hypothetical protein VHK69_21940 [Chitinophagaceae bacterium]|nr:hypothetical protein [Chitinophagaceae bacterium]